MQNWEGVSEFVAVSETNSFTGAAKRLNLSTAQVSRQVGALERRLDTKLFYRTTRKVALTEEGSLYYKHCRQVLDGLDEAERALSSLKNTPQGLLKLTAPVAYGEKYILPIVNDFMQQYPSVEMDVELTNRQVNLIDAGIDLAIRIGKLADSSLMAKRVSQRTNFVCASPEYLKRFGEPHTLSELSQHNCLSGNYDYWRFIDQGRERQVKIKGTLKCNTGHGLRDAVLKGIGIAQLPNYYISQDIEEGTLVPLLTAYQEPNEGVWALYPQNRHLSPKVRLMVDFLEANLP
ncbi:LysR substrate-binding domain-containing protein [Shewanella sp. Isolate11]|uniref:LysR substrate-binding domain-containing protein n=1 Tax=Shewanella sp. Isolate11 TaxID=2908530 RepID=UPI001EFCD44A|nr:LysR substrate-binding domain-containing protein [Shewanella sp. Isolate11]MCG9697032.1 LysR substrate-binding domain-containing protein [Shewanella sp. Isolate11]